MKYPPVGRVDDVLGPMVSVCWGVSDKTPYVENIPIADLQKVEPKPFTPEEVEERHVMEATQNLHSM